MLNEPELTQRLSVANRHIHTGTWFRQVGFGIATKPGFHVLDTSHSRDFPGRYHGNGVEALYLANNPDTANRETRSVLPGPSGAIPVAKSPVITFTIRVALHNMLLLDEGIYSLLQTSYQELTGIWNHAKSIPPTQVLGMSASSLGIEALHVPSAVALGEFNLVVFPKCLVQGSYIECFDDESGVFSERIVGC